MMPIVLNTCAPEIAELDEACGFLAEHLLVDDPDLRRLREDAVLNVSQVILKRRIGLTPGEYIGSRPEDKLLYLRMRIPDFNVERSGVLLHDTQGRVLG